MDEKPAPIAASDAGLVLAGVLGGVLLSPAIGMTSGLVGAGVSGEPLLSPAIGMTSGLGGGASASMGGGGPSLHPVTIVNNAPEVVRSATKAVVRTILESGIGELRRSWRHS